MEIDFTEYSIEELRELQNKIGNYIYNLNDGFVYICEVRSHGNNRKRVLTNECAVNDLCEEYNGYDGIVDVYTTNPGAKISNYGQVMYVQTEMDYEKWKKYNSLIGLISNAEEKLKNWENRDNIPFHSRPTFSPMWTEQDILKWRNEMELLEWTYEEPISIKKSENEEDYDNG